MKYLNISLALIWFCPTSLVAIPYTAPNPTATELPQNTFSSDVLIAQKKSKKKRRARKRHLSGEARTKGGKTQIDFGETSIDGTRRTPTGVAVSKSRPDHEYDLINLRLRWHPEMIQSTNRIETGRGR